MPRPHRADIRCSTVATCTPFSTMLVDSVVSETFCARPRTVRADIRSNEPDSHVRGSRTQRHGDFLARVHTDTDGVDRGTNSPLTQHLYCSLMRWIGSYPVQRTEIIHTPGPKMKK